MNTHAPSAWLSLLFAVILGAGLTMVVSKLAPAAVSEPEPRVFAHPQLSLEWGPARPDFDSMFRRDMPRQRSWEDAFQRPR